MISLPPPGRGRPARKSPLADAAARLPNHVGSFTTRIRPKRVEVRCRPNSSDPKRRGGSSTCRRSRPSNIPHFEILPRTNRPLLRLLRNQKPRPSRCGSPCRPATQRDGRVPTECIMTERIDSGIRNYAGKTQIRSRHRRVPHPVLPQSEMESPGLFRRLRGSGPQRREPCPLHDSPQVPVVQ